MITFAVSEVEADRSPLSTLAIRDWITRLGLRAPEAVALDCEAVVDGDVIHPLGLAVGLAFDGHRPLVITPDAIWLTLAQGLAQHIDLHADELRSRLVRHAGTLALDIRRDDFVLGNPDNDWPAAVAGLAAQVTEQLGGRARLFVGDFSTTTAIDRTASQIALLGAMRNYFSYSVSSLCGIPEITLAGTPEDWASIRARVRVFAEFDLAHWVARLEPIVAQLEATARGQVDREFWQRIYKLDHASGGDRFQGWLGDLFPYLGTDATPNEFDFDEEDPWSGIKPSDLPSGRTAVPFTWKLPDNVNLARQLVGGLFGVRQDVATAAVSVVSGWCVSTPVEPSEFRRRPGEVTQLSARDCKSLTSLAGLALEATSERTQLWLYPCERLGSLHGIEHLPQLEELDLHSASLLTDLSPLAGLASLRALQLNGCPALADLSVLDQLPGLKELVIIACPKVPLAEFARIARLDHLEKLVMTHCESLPGHLIGHTSDAATIRRIKAALTTLPRA